jgi:hypothetical protein
LNRPATLQQHKGDRHAMRSHRRDHTDVLGFSSRAKACSHTLVSTVLEAELCQQLLCAVESPHLFAHQVERGQHRCQASQTMQPPARLHMQLLLQQQISPASPSLHLSIPKCMQRTGLLANAVSCSVVRVATYRCLNCEAWPVVR